MCDFGVYEIQPGMTKTTIIFLHGHIVIKFPNQGIYVPNVNTNFQEDIPTDLTYLELKEDYCQKEYSFWINEVPSDLQGIFLRTYQLMGFPPNDITFYVQQKAEVLPENPPDATLPQRILDILTFDISHYWLSKVIERYGGRIAIKLIEFLKEHKDIVSDLSNDNLGFLHGEPVIIDYAGLYDYKNYPQPPI